MAEQIRYRRRVGRPQISERLSGSKQSARRVIVKLMRDQLAKAVRLKVHDHPSAWRCGWVDWTEAGLPATVSRVGIDNNTLTQLCSEYRGMHDDIIIHPSSRSTMSSAMEKVLCYAPINKDPDAFEPLPSLEEAIAADEAARWRRWQHQPERMEEVIATRRKYKEVEREYPYYRYGLKADKSSASAARGLCGGRGSMRSKSSTRTCLPGGYEYARHTYRMYCEQGLRHCLHLPRYYFSFNVGGRTVYVMELLRGTTVGELACQTEAGAKCAGFRYDMTLLCRHPSEVERVGDVYLIAAKIHDHAVATRTFHDFCEGYNNTAEIPRGTLMCRPATKALGFLHHRRLSHGDVKANNVMVLKARAVLIDLDHLDYDDSSGSGAADDLRKTGKVLLTALGADPQTIERIATLTTPQSVAAMLASFMPYQPSGELIYFILQLYHGHSTAQEVHSICSFRCRIPVCHHCIDPGWSTLDKKGTKPM
ncbi:unnamed protein product [Vitrella brassicaformis CCMP3155]|uniref:Protein kinase domain-containing protein n=1 Tax=Vitrella brassicaformis (strain CCMP3155) TaxID=1169540 RepID=A0A0G4EE88_VITBC|nr:unnamed protein product [Vitrella brassicaformis CCMP3155]|eukprot:CEL93869.1 unnamed protein product [Vitrella brassicaformis CCMP3155]